MSDLEGVPMPVLREAGSLAAVYPIAPSFDDLGGDRFAVEPPYRPRGNGRSARAAAAFPLRRVLEAVLFATDRPVTVEQLLCAVPEENPKAIEEELLSMSRAYREEGAGFQLVETGGSYQLRTDPELHDYVTRFLVGKKRSRLSRAAMESLAIIAYRQPLTRGDVEQIRGVDCGQVLHTLLERNLVAIRGRSQALGRPLLYATTEDFLHYFGISSLADLPTPDELESLLGRDPLEDPEIRDALEAHGLGPVSEGEAAASEESPLETEGGVGRMEPAGGFDRIEAGAGPEPMQEIEVEKIEPEAEVEETEPGFEVERVEPEGEGSPLSCEMARGECG